MRAEQAAEAARQSKARHDSNGRVHAIMSGVQNLCLAHSGKIEDLATRMDALAEVPEMLKRIEKRLGGDSALGSRGLVSELEDVRKMAVDTQTQLEKTTDEIGRRITQLTTVFATITGLAAILTFLRSVFNWPKFGP
jgi:DNA repair ATPase RecN